MIKWNIIALITGITGQDGSYLSKFLLEKGINWKNSVLEEVGNRADTKELVKRFDPMCFRLTEFEQLLGNVSITRKKLNWQPKASLKELISEMNEEDSNQAKKAYLLKSKGFLKYFWEE